MSNEKSDKLMMYNSRKMSSGTAWVLFLFLGWSYGSMDKMGKQILFYLTLGGLGLWSLYRLFTLSGAIKEYNRNIALSLGLETQEIMMLGLM
jgi:hypothetical protein